MGRLIDDIRAGGKLKMPPWCGTARDAADYSLIHESIRTLIRKRDLPVIEVTNVSDYYFAGSDQETWNETNFPNVAPPFEQFWMEFRMPSRVHSTLGDTDISDLKRSRVGCILTYLPLDGGGWKVVMNPLLEDYNASECVLVGPLADYTMDITAEGVMPPSWRVVTLGGKNVDQEKIMSYIPCLHPFLLAISFMHCKNVIVERNTVPVKLAKKQHERHGVWPVPYRTLVIEPLKQVLRSEGKSDQHGLARAMHICRGHFKDYRQGAGLFGKYHQLVWHPSIVRGTVGHEPPPRKIKVKAPSNVS